MTRLPVCLVAVFRTISTGLSEHWVQLCADRCVYRGVRCYLLLFLYAALWVLICPACCSHQLERKVKKGRLLLDACTLFL